VGRSPDGLAGVQLVGSPDELVQASIWDFLSADNRRNALLLSYMVRMQELLLPDWKSFSDWFIRTLSKAPDAGLETYKAKTTIQGIDVTMTVENLLSSVVLTFERGG
jgi:hypothetical protein